MKFEHQSLKYLEQIFDYIQDGIVVMDQNRTILLMNPSAVRLTGWQLDGKVPFCQYCQNREVLAGEERCYLISKRKVPYFLSSMPTYEGTYIDVEMSTAVMYENEDENRQEILLVLKDMTLKKKEEEAKLSKLLLQKTLQAQEAEHKRLARELHDGIGQSLFSIAVGIQAIKRHLNEVGAFPEYIEELSSVIDNVIRDVKLYSSQLRPHSIDQLGLVPSVAALLQTLQRTYPNVQFTFTEDVPHVLPSELRINFYRVIQEAVHNALKYAQATMIAVQLTVAEHTIHLSVLDDGVGFDLATSKDGLGIKHMEERVHQIGGTFQIVTSPGTGCEIRVRVPFEEEV